MRVNVTRIALDSHIIQFFHGYMHSTRVHITQISIFYYSVWLPEMISGHVLNILVDHMKSDRFRLAIAPYGPRVLVPVVTLGFRGRRHNATGRCWRHPVLVDTRYHYAGYNFTQGIRQQHLEMYPNRALKQHEYTIHVNIITKDFTVKYKNKYSNNIIMISIVSSRKNIYTYYWLKVGIGYT